MVRGTGEAIVMVMVMLMVLVVVTSAKRPPKATNGFYWSTSFCLSWRVGVEANNVLGWPTVPTECVAHVAVYMYGGQWEQDLSLVVDNIIRYADTIALSSDGKDAWILDVDDTCISNLQYYTQKEFGGLPYDPPAFKRWALTASSSKIPQVLRLFNYLIETGFKVILLTGRDEETLGNATALNLKKQGYSGYHRLILRATKYKGQSAISFKSQIRKQLVYGEGLRILGNVGDEWSDLLGDYPGNRTFKIPNPMYFVP